MNHLKGDESTRPPGRYSLRSTCPRSPLCGGGRAPKTAAGPDISEGRNLCGGFRPSLVGAVVRESEAEPCAVGFGRSEVDTPDCVDGDDDLLRPAPVVSVDRKRDEAVAGFRRKRLNRQPSAVGELDLDFALLRRVRRRVLPDLLVDARH